MIAYIERKGKPVKLLPSASRREETWSVRRSGGQRSSFLYCCAAGVLIPNTSEPPYDVRTIPPQPRIVIEGYDRRIAALQKERQTFIEDSFRTWPITQAKDCQEVLPGRSKEEAAKGLPDMKTTRAKAVRERRMLGDLNRALGEA